MFNAKQKKALAIAGISIKRIAMAEKAMAPKPRKLKRWEILRIEELRSSEGMAIITSKRIFSKAGWHQKLTTGAQVLKDHKAKKAAAVAAK